PLTNVGSSNNIRHLLAGRTLRRGGRDPASRTRDVVNMPPIVRKTPEPERPAARRPSTDAGGSSSRNIAWVIVWVGLGLAVGLWVAGTHGRSAATEYFAAYLLEESLSIDNI